MSTVLQEPPHYQSSNASVGSDEDSPTNTPGRAPKAVKDAAVWSSAETGSASASPTSATAYDAVLVEEGTVSLNDRNNGSNAGSYGSTALVSGSSGGSSGVSSGDGGVAKPGTTKWSSREGESAKLLSHAGGGVEGRAAGYQQDDDDDGDGDDEDRREGTWSSLEEGGGEKGGRSRKCGRWGAITPPLGLCLFGYFVNKLITEVNHRQYGCLFFFLDMFIREKWNFKVRRKTRKRHKMVFLHLVCIWHTVEGGEIRGQAETIQCISDFSLWWFFRLEKIWNFSNCRYVNFARR